MNKYIKFDDIDNVIRDNHAKASSQEIGEELFELYMEVSQLPTIEVSEDSIDRYAVLAELDPQSIEYKIIKDLPSVVINDRPKGKWNWHGDEDICSCPYCDFEIDAEGCIDPVEYVKIYNYCPNCGAQLGVDIGGYDGERVDGGEE